MKNRDNLYQITNSTFSRLIAVSENYPEIKPSEAFKSLMNAVDYNWKEKLLPWEVFCLY